MRETFVPHTAADGTRLHVVRWEPAEPKSVRAVMHIAHGMAEHCGRYQRLAEALTQAGFVVFANDHRGHGKTAQPSADANASELGHLADEGGWGAALGDLRALVRKEQAAYPGLPFVLFGHSMGSFMVQELLFDLSDVLAAAVLSGSNGKPTPIAAAGRLVARAEKLRLGARGHSKLLIGLSFDTFNKAFAPNRTAFDWLSRDEAEVDAYVADPHCGFPCSTATWIEVLDALGRIATPNLQRRIRKDLPIYIFSGARDAANGNTQGLVQLLGAYQRAGLREVSHRFYEGARHEVLNETNRDEVTRDLLSFLDRKVLCDARSTS
jgi:alpha-beta hydrolase superfamily lysophospholipase